MDAPHFAVLNFAHEKAIHLLLTLVLNFPHFKVVQSGGKNIELAVMRRNQPLKVRLFWFSVLSTCGYFRGQLPPPKWRSALKIFVSALYIRSAVSKLETAGTVKTQSELQSTFHWGA